MVRPNQRYQTIKEIVENRRFNDDKYLKEIGMTVNDEEMLTVEGRLIAPPEVKYISGRDGKSEVIERVNIGKSVLRAAMPSIDLDAILFSTGGIYAINFKSRASSKNGPA